MMRLEKNEHGKECEQYQAHQAIHQQRSEDFEFHEEAE